jgi:hypothetical protein
MKTLNVGVTGTRNGMNTYQENRVIEYLNMLKNKLPLYDTYQLHHGDCVGVDVEVAKIAQELGYKTVNHPPVDSELRAYHESDIILEPKTHFARNRDIVNNSEILLVVPMENSHQTKGGTWYTHDYATKRNHIKSIVIFYPSGKNFIFTKGKVL